MAEPQRILLVDDEVTLIKTVGRRLELNGYQVIPAMDGAEGLEKAKSERPDLIILDLMMPKMDGYEVCQALKSDPAHRAIPILILTAKQAKSDEEKAMAAGADDYLCKPFRAAELLGKIKALLAKSAS